MAWDVINQKIGTKQQEAITPECAHSFLAERLFMTPGSADSCLGPASLASTLHQQVQGSASSRHCCCNPQHNLPSPSLQPGGKGGKARGKAQFFWVKRHEKTTGHPASAGKRFLIFRAFKGPCPPPPWHRHPGSLKCRSVSQASSMSAALGFINREDAQPLEACP